MEHLSGTDAAFLHLETPETPMHTGAFMLLDVPPDAVADFHARVSAVVAQRIHLCPALVRKLATMPFEMAEPVWIDDDDIDLEYHIRHVTLPRPGSMQQLERLLARLHATLLDRSRPLWEMTVIDGLADGRVAFYLKTHHAAVDGGAAVRLAKVLYDDSPSVRPVPPPRRTRRGSHGYQLGMAEMLQAAFDNSARQYRRLASLLPAAATAMQSAAKILAEQRRPFGERPLELGMAPPTIFNDSITNQRSYSTMTMSLAQTKALGQRVGGTVNTIVMAMCSLALSSFLKERQAMPKQSLIANVPVSLRSAEDDSMNNQVWSIRVDLATDIDDLGERFKAIHASSEAAKAVVRELRPVLGVDVPIIGAPWLMTGMATLYGRANLATQLPATSNVMISNVPGSPGTLHLAGARMLHWYPMSIPYHGAGLNITVHSYNGQLEWGLMACRRVVSQEESYELLRHLQDALKQIEALATTSVSTAPAAPARHAPRRRPAATPPPRRAKASTAR